MKVVTLVLAILLLLAYTVGAAPELSLSSHTPNCGTFLNVQNCETVYKITNNDLTALAISNSNLKVYFRTEKDNNLIEKLPEGLGSYTLELNDKGAYSEITPGLFSTNMDSGKEIYLKIKAVKTWVRTEEPNEWKLLNIDNVISFNGVNYTQYAWWNATMPYKQQFNFTSPASVTNGQYVYVNNFTSQIAANKIDPNTFCYQIVNEYENQTILSEHISGNLTYNFSALIYDNVTAGNNVRYIYYYLGNCTDKINNAFLNQSGLMHAVFPTMNQTSATVAFDAANSRNFTITGSVSKVPRFNGMSFYFPHATGAYVSRTSDWFNNLAQGTVFAIVRLEDIAVLESMILSRIDNPAGYSTADLRLAHTSGTNKFRFSLNNGVNYATGTTNVIANKYYAIAGVWNASGWFIYVNGTIEGSYAGGALPNQPAYNLMIGTLNPADINNAVNGTISNVLFYNRSLSDAEVKALSVMYINQSGIEESESSSGNTITVYAYDEVSLAALTFNATFNNGTASYTTPDGASYSAQYTDFPLGLNTITFKATGYYPREFITYNTNTTQVVYGYLLNSGLSTSARVNVYLTSVLGASISDGNITLQKVIAGNVTTLGGCLTDATGTCYFYLDLDSTYIFTASKVGYTSKTISVRPTVSGFSIVLNSALTPTYSPDYEGITQYLNPDILNATSNWTIINYTIKAANIDLTKYGLNLSYAGSYIFNQEFTNASGGSILVNLTTYGKANNVTAVAYFNKTSGDQVYLKVYYIHNTTYSNTSITSIADNVINSGGGTTSFLLFVVFLTIIIVSSMTKGLPIAIGGGVFAVVVLGFLMLFMFPLTSWVWLIFFPGLVLFAIVLAKTHSGM